MSTNSIVNPSEGFSVYQPALGATLQFYPALGTQQLDDLINAYLPGPASLNEKRATISMDFCEFSQQTGESFKYYSVCPMPFNTTMGCSAHSSPAGNPSLVSPAISDWSWSQSTPASASSSTTPSSSAHDLSAHRSNDKSSRRTSGLNSRTQSNDFSHIPGMRIMTRDGKDVTNSASRGCKTKEQRDHAHLMRVIKACESCRRKKIRCDPSHKKRAAPQSQSHPSDRIAKKVKQSSRKGHDSAEIIAPYSHENGTASLASNAVLAELAGFDPPSFQSREPWESFIQYDDEPTESIVPFDYDFFFDPEGHISPASGTSSASASQPLTPDQPTAASSANHTEWCFTERPEDGAPTLPYLDRSRPTTQYIDFNLYSPPSSFLDDDPGLSADISACKENIQLDDRPLSDHTDHTRSQLALEEIHSPGREHSASVPGASSDILGSTALSHPYCSTVLDATDWTWSHTATAEVGALFGSLGSTAHEPPTPPGRPLGTPHKHNAQLAGTQQSAAAQDSAEVHRLEMLGVACQHSGPREHSTSPAVNTVIEPTLSILRSSSEYSQTAVASLSQSSQSSRQRRVIINSDAGALASPTTPSTVAATQASRLEPSGHSGRESHLELPLAIPSGSRAVLSRTSKSSPLAPQPGLEIMSAPTGRVRDTIGTAPIVAVLQGDERISDRRCETGNHSRYLSDSSSASTASPSTALSGLASLLPVGLIRKQSRQSMVAISKMWLLTTMWLGAVLLSPLLASSLWNVAGVDGFAVLTYSVLTLVGLVFRNCTREQGSFGWNRNRNIGVLSQASVYRQHHAWANINRSASLCFPI